MTTSVDIRDTQAPAKTRKFARLRECLHTNKQRAAERSLLVATTVFLAMPAWAQDDFADFADKVEELAHGPFGIGISILALIIGCLVGLGRQSAAPAFLGLGIAGAFAVGPFMIKEIFSWFSGT